MFTRGLLNDLKLWFWHADIWRCYSNAVAMYNNHTICCVVYDKRTSFTTWLSMGRGLLVPESVGSPSIASEQTLLTTRTRFCPWSRWSCDADSRQSKYDLTLVYSDIEVEHVQCLSDVGLELSRSKV